MRKYICIFIILFLLSFGEVQSQVAFNLGFYKHLVAQKETDLVFSYLNNCALNEKDTATIDSIQFYIGKIFFNNKQFKESVTVFNKVSKQASLSNEALLYKAIGLVYLDSSEKYIQNELLTLKGDTVLEQVKLITLASIALIYSNLKVYDSLVVKVQDSLFYYNELQLSLNKWRIKAVKRKKSPLTAALLSALIPGMGKVYGGKPFDGLSTFLTHIPLGLILWESATNAGINSARFITFSAITSLFYIGNIFTSYLYINKHGKEENSAKKNEILLRCNIMLRNYYN
jgi:TM2 domain-containing membrane protein YozV